MKEKSKGLGDTIAKITKATGIDKVAKAVLGDDCGCEERRKKLNQMFPNFKNIRQFTEDEIKIYDEVIPTVDKKGMLTPAERQIVSALYVGVFGANPEWKSCSPCNKRIMDNLKKVYEKSCKI
tara:strand:+ start:984 stop:1352 length:369 start_codon:yes stop_codon:yes gene_type:complete